MVEMTRRKDKGRQKGFKVASVFEEEWIERCLKQIIISAIQRLRVVKTELTGLS